MELEARIEAILFWKGEPVAHTALSKLLGVPDEEIATALTVLGASLSARGIRLVQTEREVALVTAPEMTELIDTLRKDDMKRDIGKAGAETLAIVLYKGPVARSEIDYIRGVNSSFILRNLMMRGLVERVEGNDRRSFAYTATTDLLSHLGVSQKEELPDYATTLAALDRFMTEREEGETAQQPS